MQTTRVILTAKEDREFGGIGLEIEGVACEGFNPAQEGLVIAHDLLEHPNGPQHIGTIDDELEALGGVWYVRGQQGELRQDGRGSAYTVHQSIASDIVRMFRDFFYGAEADISAPEAEACDADEDFRLILRHVRKDYLKELDDIEHEEARELFDQYESAAFQRMRAGYHKAEARFPNALAAWELFWAIAKACDNYAKHAEYEGAQYVLEYGFWDDGKPFACCQEHYPEEDEEEDDE